MKYFWLVIPLILSSCTSIRYVTTDHGRLITDAGKPVTIAGNPPVACHLAGSHQVYTGYFMYQDDDGRILLDDYGRGTVELNGNVICTLLNEEK